MGVVSPGWAPPTHPSPPAKLLWDEQGQAQAGWSKWDTQDAGSVLRRIGRWVDGWAGSGEAGEAGRPGPRGKGVKDREKGTSSTVYLGSFTKLYDYMFLTLQQAGSGHKQFLRGRGQSVFPGLGRMHSGFLEVSEEMDTAHLQFYLQFHFLL